MNQKPIIFTHIQKTAGTSVMKELLYRNYKQEEIKRFWGGYGIKKFIFSDTSSYNVFTGHMPYGIHHFIKRECEYFTFLRDPIKRAISQYNFIKNNIEAGGMKNKYKDSYNNIALKDVFDQRVVLNPFKGGLVDNLQTRMLAGYLYFPLSKNSELMLSRAKKNLEKKYKVFGIQEYYEDSIKQLVESFEWDYSPTGMIAKKTQKKDEVDDETQQVLFENHNLDIKLYSFAQELFKSRIK